MTLTKNAARLELRSILSVFLLSPHVAATRHRRKIRCPFAVYR